MSERILRKHGFEEILMGSHWRKDGFGVSMFWENNQTKYVVARATSEPINSEDDLKFYFKKYTGKEL